MTDGPSGGLETGLCYASRASREVASGELCRLGNVFLYSILGDTLTPGW